MAIDGTLVPIVLFATAGAVAIATPLVRAYARRIDRESLQPKVPAEVQARLERMEQALEAISIEVERISEGQRFTTKLLAERGSESGGPRRPPVNLIPNGGVGGGE